MEQGFEMAKKERELKGNDCPITLSQFIDEHQEKMTNLSESCKLATVSVFYSIPSDFFLQRTYESCVEFYGESPKVMQPNVFFSKLSNFVGSFKRAKADNDSREATVKVCSDRIFSIKMYFCSDLLWKQKEDRVLLNDMNNIMIC